jgi:NitT/TauT family transport system substrate-binding protein
MFPDAQTLLCLYSETIFNGKLVRDRVVLHRVRRREFSAMAAVSLMMTPWTASADANPQRVSIALAAKSSLYHLPLILADQLGFFKNEGLQIDWLECESGLQAVQMAISGQADIVSGAFEHTIDLQARGLSFRAFVLQGRAHQISVGLTTRKAASMKSVADLNALKLGVSSLGSATHWVAQHWIKQAGLQAENIQWVEIGASTGNVLESLKSGNVDALCHTDPILHYLAQKNEVRVVADTRTLSSSRRLFGGPMLSACLFGKTEFLQKQAGTTQKLSTWVVRALKWLKTAGPTDILKTVPSYYWMGDRALYLGALEKVRDSYSLDGLFANNALQTTWRARAARVTTDKANWTILGRTYTNEFALAAKRKVVA